MLSGYPAGSEKPVAEKSPTLERKYQHHGELLWELLLRQRRWDRLPANLTLKEDRASVMTVWLSFTGSKGYFTPKWTFRRHLLTFVLFQTSTVSLSFWHGNQKKNSASWSFFYHEWELKLTSFVKDVKVTHTKPCDSLYEQTGISLFTDDGTFLKFLKVWKTYEQEFICIPHVLARLTLLILGCVGCIKISSIFLNIPLFLALHTLQCVKAASQR